MEKFLDFKNFTYILISRYLTYILTYIGSVIMLGNNLKSIVLFTLLFSIVLITSSIRVSKTCRLMNKIYLNRAFLFIPSIVIELITIIFINYYFSHLTFVLIFIPIVDIFLFLNFKKAILVSILPYTTLVLVTCFKDKNLSFESTLSDILSYLLALTFFACASYLLKTTILMKDKMQLLYSELKESKEDLETANKKLKDYSKKVEEVSVLNERNRLAGEIHDTIGHSLTALIMEVDICNKLIDKDVNKTKVELKKAQELARYSLSEVRKSVRSIKSTDKLTGINAIKSLINDYEKNTGIAVHFNISRRQYKLSPTIEVTIFRAVQEALTNCAKYGHASNAYIDISFKESGVSFCISNDGLSCADINKGVGLTTMQERVEVLGGNLKVSGENNFSINGFIPVEVKNE